MEYIQLHLLFSSEHQNERKHAASQNMVLKVSNDVCGKMF